MARTTPCALDDAIMHEEPINSTQQASSEISCLLSPAAGCRRYQIDNAIVSKGKTAACDALRFGPLPHARLGQSRWPVCLLWPCRVANRSLRDRCGRSGVTVLPWPSALPCINSWPDVSTGFDPDSSMFDEEQGSLRIGLEPE